MDNNSKLKKVRFYFSIFVLLNIVLLIVRRDFSVITIVLGISHMGFGAIMFAKYRIPRDIWYMALGILWFLMYIVYF